MNHIASVVFLGAFLSVLPANVLSQSSPDSIAVMDSIRALEARYGGHLGMMALNLRTGEEIRYNASERFPTASAIKVAIMAAYFDRVHKGLLDPNAPVQIRDEDKKPGSGILQFLKPGGTLSVQDAMRLMIIMSDNTATNLVLDHLGPDLGSQLDCVNALMRSSGLSSTRLLNRLFSWQTKRNSPEGLRYGIGVSTPEDMVKVMSLIYHRQLVDDSASAEMFGTLALQLYNDMIPKYLPVDGPSHLEIAHKTGSVTETKVDVGLVISDSTDFALAIFVDKSPDHSEGIQNSALELGAQISRFVWARWSVPEENRAPEYDVDWTRIQGGSWGIYRSRFAPFPHPDRSNGFRREDGTYYPYFPHYADSSIVVFVPDSLRPVAGAINAIVHFHGHGHDNLDILENSGMIPAMEAMRINAVLILPQGPFRARDSFGGKMEDEGGLRRMLDDVMDMLGAEKVASHPRLGHLIISAHSGGYRPAAFCVDRGEVQGHLDGVFLFDALYGFPEKFTAWLEHSNGFLYAAYTAHLQKEHSAFVAGLSEGARRRVEVEPADVDHEHVVPEFFPRWLVNLPAPWHW